MSGEELRLRSQGSIFVDAVLLGDEVEVGWWEKGRDIVWPSAEFPIGVLLDNPSYKWPR